MATIKVIFRRTSPQSCEGTLFYRIIHRREVRQVNTGCRITSNEWDDEHQEVTSLSIRSKIKDGLARFSQIITNLEKSGNRYSTSDIVNQYLAPDTVVGIISFARRHIAELRQIGKTRLSEHYTTAINSFIRFCGADDILFDQFDSNLILRYEYHLKERGLCPNSTSYYMRNLRAIFNRAVEQGYTSQSKPFKHVYTGIAKTVKRAVNISTIRALRNLDLDNNSDSRLARDLFIFSFYTRGMAIIDVAFLRKSNICNGYLSYRRQKTGQRLTIRWEPQMQELVERYQCDESDFIFPMIDSSKPDYRKQYRSSYNKINKRLKALGAAVGLSEPLTFHRSRHGWASIAKENNVPLSVICEGMGHDSEKTTLIYLASLDNSAVDMANSAIINLIEN